MSLLKEKSRLSIEKMQHYFITIYNSIGTVYQILVNKVVYKDGEGMELRLYWLIVTHYKLKYQ